jgi:ankyrin repeat protein
MGETVLYVAARSGDVESVKYLLTHGASPGVAEKTKG